MVCSRSSRQRLKPREFSTCAFAASLRAGPKTYPQLRAVREFTQLQNTLGQIEDTSECAAVLQRRRSRLQHHSRAIPPTTSSPAWDISMSAIFPIRRPSRREARRVSSATTGLSPNGYLQTSGLSRISQRRCDWAKRKLRSLSACTGFSCHRRPPPGVSQSR